MRQLHSMTRLLLCTEFGRVETKKFRCQSVHAQSNQAGFKMMMLLPQGCRRDSESLLLLQALWATPAKVPCSRCRRLHGIGLVSTLHLYESHSFSVLTADICFSKAQSGHKRPEACSTLVLLEAVMVEVAMRHPRQIHNFISGNSKRAR